MSIQIKRKPFLKELSNLLFFWFFAVLFFTAFRIIFITIFSKKIQSTPNFIEIVDVFFMGFRFDCTAIAYFLILPFLSLLLLAPFDLYRPIAIIRKVHQIIFIVLSTLICVITINYFKEYDNQFNNFLFLALYDDQKAVLHTIIEYYHPIINSVIIILSIVTGLYIFNYFRNKKTIYQFFKKVRFKKSKYVFALITLVFFIFGIRGSVSSIPALRQYSGVSNDVFLNKTIINPFRSLDYAISDFKRVNLMNVTNPFMKEKEFEKTFTTKKVTDQISKIAQGPTIEKPKQIFLIVMESYDSWPLMDKYLPFGFSNQLNSIAKNGTHFTHFLPSGNTTIDSFGAILTNVPNCGINLSHIGTINDPFDTSIFTQFKKLGYQTNLYYGGYLSWENIGELARYEGVDRIFSGVDGGGKTDTGGWGIEDEKLFNLVFKNTDKNKYSLNIILTTSYHAPYAVDLDAKGFPYQSTDEFPVEMKKYYDGSMNLKELGHLWYGDKALGDFVKKAEKMYSDNLFCFTGDHYGRKFINSKPNLYEKSSVAFILYGKNIPKSVNTTPGSHIDIMPTLIEMIAPKGFQYYSFGTSMFDKNKTEGIGFQKMITQNELYYFPNEAKFQKIDLTTYTENLFKKNNLVDKHNKMMALAWYYTRKGNLIKPNKSN